MALRLRKAEKKDMDMLFAWANDEQVRQYAFHTEKISYDEHVAWYARRLADEDCYIFLLESEEKSVGQIRFEIEAGEATIDYSVDALERGKGYGTDLIKMGTKQLKKMRPDVERYLAQVKYENMASAKVFEKCGFQKSEKTDFIEFVQNKDGVKDENSDCND